MNPIEFLLTWVLACTFLEMPVGRTGLLILVVMIVCG